MLIDSHCHLDYLLKDGDLQEALGRARAAGVVRMVTISTKLSSFDTIHGIAQQEDDVFCTVGIHPHESGGLDEPELLPQLLVEKGQNSKVVGIGESGLDYCYNCAPRDRQAVSFRAHIEAARKTQLPLVVHSRDAEDDTIKIMQEEHLKGAYPAIIHCFSAGQKLADASLEMGFYISLSGILTYKSAQPIREVVRSVPLERLLVETDSPYLAPIPHRGKRNEPAHVVHTAAALADIKGLTADEMAQQTTDNFFRLFTKVPPVQS